METAKYITVLDYEQGDVCQYPIELWGIDSKDIKTRLTELGHNTSKWWWMIHKNKPIIH